MYRLAVHPRAEAPGRAHSPFLLRLGHPVAGHKVLCTSTVARGAPWARHPPAGHERAPNCASTGRSRGCIAQHECRRKVGGARERHHGVFRGSHRRGTLHLHDFAHCPALPVARGSGARDVLEWNYFCIRILWCACTWLLPPWTNFQQIKQKKISLSSGVT